MSETLFSDEHDRLLSELIRRTDIRLEDLPYTPEFERVYAEFLHKTAEAVDRHTVWLRIVHLRRDGKKDVGSPLIGSTPFSAIPAQTQSPAAFQTAPVEGLPLAVGDQLALFRPSVIGQQPWSLPPTPQIDDQAVRERQQLLADIAESRLGKMEQRVAYILQRFPETRDSDTSLVIRYWTQFQPAVLEQWDKLSLEVLFELDRQETISRIRRHIQNDLGLFISLLDTRRRRNEAQTEFHEYLTAERGTGPEVRFYLDETGNEGGKTYLGVGGVCIMNWRQYEKHRAALAQWRQTRGWPETIHFVETGSALQPRAMALLSELEQRRSGLLFLGYALLSRGQTHQDLLTLFIQLIVDALHHMERLGCLEEATAVRVVKEADAGFDSVYLNPMEQCLGEQIGREFPGRLAVHPISAVPKGREVMLECADLIASGMQRRALYKGQNPKDVLAETVFNVTGFEDPR